MRRDLRVKKKMLKRYFKNVFREFKLRKRMLKRSMSKREKLSKIWRNRFSKYNPLMKERMLFSWRSTRILRSSRESSLRILNLITKS